MTNIFFGKLFDIEYKSFLALGKILRTSREVFNIKVYSVIKTV